MSQLALWQTLLLGGALAVSGTLLAIWWRQQTPRWATLVTITAGAALALSWWSGLAFQVADYRVGCDGLCPGARGAPIAFFAGAPQGGNFLPLNFVINVLVYLSLLLAWLAVIRAMLWRNAADAAPHLGHALLGGLLFLLPIAASPWILPPPEAVARGDAMRVAINARREVYLYDQLAPWPVLRVGLTDVRPRPDEAPGLRVCLRAYTFFYLPVGHIYLDMTPEGVHSNAGGHIAPPATCWQP